MVSESCRLWRMLMLTREWIRCGVDLLWMVLQLLHPSNI